jgi:hypothetical protein
VPWEKRQPYPCGLKGRENLFLLVRTEALSDVVGRLKKSSNDWLRNRGPQAPGQRSRDLPSNKGLFGLLLTRRFVTASQNRVPASRAFRPHRVVNLSTQGIGLRPRPWAPFSRPVGPDGPATISLILRNFCPYELARSPCVSAEQSLETASRLSVCPRAIDQP